MSALDLKTIVWALVACVAVMSVPRCIAAEAGIAVRFIEGCSADFNGDNAGDLALLYEGSLGVEFTVFLKRDNRYKGYVLYQGTESNLRLSCRYVKTAVVTKAGKGDREKSITIDGWAIVLEQPESSRSLFYWNKNGFSQVWLAD